MLLIENDCFVSDVVSEIGVVYETADRLVSLHEHLLLFAYGEQCNNSSSRVLYTIFLIRGHVFIFLLDTRNILQL